MHLAITITLLALFAYGMFRVIRFAMGPPPVPKYRPAKPLDLKRPRANADRLSCRQVDWNGKEAP